MSIEIFLILFFLIAALLLYVVIPRLPFNRLFSSIIIMAVYFVLACFAWVNWGVV